MYSLLKGLTNSTYMWAINMSGIEVLPEMQLSPLNQSNLFAALQ
jgi:hypothetical protein